MSIDSQSRLADIYDAFLSEIYRYCSYRLYSRDAAEDATSCVFEKLIQHFPQVQGRSHAEIRRWLYGTASNVVVSQLREKRNRQTAFQELARSTDSLISTEGNDYPRLDWPVLYRAISTLKGKQQDIVILRYFEGLETSEIAQVVGMSHVAVRVSLTRAMRRLRQLLQVPFEGSDA